MHAGDSSVDVASNLVQNIQTLKAEVSRLQSQLRMAQTERKWHAVILCVRISTVLGSGVG